MNSLIFLKKHIESSGTEMRSSFCMNDFSKIQFYPIMIDTLGLAALDVH